MGHEAMRVLVTDFRDDTAIERAVLPDVEVEALLALAGRAPTPDDLLRVLAERPAGVLIAWHEMFFTAETLASLGRMGVRGIVRAGVGYDNVDLDAARAAGITICNVPDYGTDEVADHAMALGFKQIQFDSAQCSRDLDAFAELLEREELQEQEDILPFFKEHPHLALFMGIFNPNLSKCDLLGSEYDLDGICQADLVIGDSENHCYCFVEFEPGTLSAVFDVAGRRMTEWSKRFEHGFGQIIDWFWLLHSGENSQLFQSRFGSPEINATALLIIGRDAGISDGDRQRYTWRRDRIIVDSRPVQFYTYDELLATLRRRFDFLSRSPEG